MTRTLDLVHFSISLVQTNCSLTLLYLTQLFQCFLYNYHRDFNPQPHWSADTSWTNLHYTMSTKRRANLYISSAPLVLSDLFLLVSFCFSSVCFRYSPLHQWTRPPLYPEGTGLAKHSTEDSDARDGETNHFTKRARYQKSLPSLKSRKLHPTGKEIKERF